MDVEKVFADFVDEFAFLFLDGAKFWEDVFKEPKHLSNLCTAYLSSLQTYDFIRIVALYNRLIFFILQLQAFTSQKITLIQIKYRNLLFQ